ncbi:MAG: redox-sensing transcriptional repressor Rex [Bacteroidales bacterium]|nr:redox-sensing transcriptional repressor Rex [Bacteroidales bacterium]HNT92474.1 redox-sensing transcriptional repressor Rex [Bacteroidales bacterium]HPE21453.1 redox-sensing transcriptional repressor Rex [Bacteroidales bacterium]
MKTLPGKTVERLSQYRRALAATLAANRNYVFSHELAAMLHITAVQVRRDLMLIGYGSVMRKGYDVRELIKTIGLIIDAPSGLNVAIIGMGNLGRAITGYFKGKRTNMNVVAAFDVDPQKVDKVVAGVRCHNINQLRSLREELDISVAVLTVPADQAVSVASTLVSNGIRGIMNFTTVSLNVPDNVYLEEFDMITSIEKVAYFVKENQQPAGL